VQKTLELIYGIHPCIAVKLVYPWEKEGLGAS
jgi:hypothetical protein